MARPVGNPNIDKIGFKKREDCSKEQWEKQKSYWGKKRERKWTKEVCVLQLEELMDFLKEKIKDNDFKELQIIIDKMMDIIRYLYPPVQQNLNVNIETTSNAVIERLKAWKKKQVVVVEDEEIESSE